VLLGIVRNAAFGCQKDTRQLRSQFFPSIVGIPEMERLCEPSPVQTGGVSTPMRHFELCRADHRFLVETGRIGALMRHNQRASRNESRASSGLYLPG